jgi:hypothetical protein
MRASAQDRRAAESAAPPFALDLTLGVFLAAMAALSAPWTFGRFALPWDAAAQFYPNFVFLSDALHAGDTPFWNPRVFAGTPQIADPQSLIFSPAFVALAALAKEPSFALFAAAVFLHLALGGVGVILFGRDRGWREPATLVAALAFAFGGAAIWRVQHVGQIASLSFLPLALWAWARALERERFGWGLAAGFFAAMMAIGRDQVALLGLWTLALYALARWLGFAGRVRFALAPLAGGALAGLLIVALPVLLTASFAAMSNRPQIDLADAQKGSLHPASLLSFFVGDYFGLKGPLEAFWGPPSPIWGPTDLFLARNMTALYQGALPALLVLAVPFRGVWRDPTARFATLGLVVALLYALGRYTPVHAALFHLPGADFFRRPADATFLIGFFAALLAGAAADRWLTAPPRSGRVAASALFAALLGLGALMVWLAREKGAPPVAGRALGYAAVAYVVAAASLWLARRVTAAGPLAGLLALGLPLVADLALTNGPNESTALPKERFAMLAPRGDDPLVEAIAAAIASPAPTDRRDRVELVALGFDWPNVPMTRGWDGALGYNPLRLALFTRATGAGDHVALADQRRWAPAYPSYRSPMADLLGLRWIVAGAPLSRLDPRLPDDSFPVLARIGAATIYDRGAPAPRVAMATRALPVDAAALLETGRWPVFDPRDTVLLDAAVTTASSSGVAPPGAARIESYRNDEVVVAVEAPAAGWLVLHDAHHPWWAVEIDGAEAPLLRANLMFRAVAVDAGAHRVRFVFRPFRGVARDVADGLFARLDAVVALIDRAIPVAPAPENRPKASP